jgi:hypothetical protein
MSGGGLSLPSSRLFEGASAETSDRRELWKQVSRLEREAVDLLGGGSSDEAFKLLSRSQALKKTDPFLQLASAYSLAETAGNTEECERLLAAMRNAGVPPHLASVGAKKQALGLFAEDSTLEEEVDIATTFSDTVTEKIRVKVSSFFDTEKSEPSVGKYMFWYKVSIYNEGISRPHKV